MLFGRASATRCTTFMSFRLFCRDKAFWVAAEILLASGCNLIAQQPECQSLTESNPAAMLSYLQQDRGILESSCIQRAIRNLGAENLGVEEKPAVRTLITYLDFKQPGPVFVMHPGPTGGLFPAAEALAKIGGPAIPALRNALSSDENNKLQRVNAARTYLFLVRDKASAISFVAKTSRSSPDRDVGDALMHVAENAAKYCEPNDQKRCKEALNEQ